MISLQGVRLREYIRAGVFVCLHSIGFLSAAVMAAFLLPAAHQSNMSVDGGTSSTRASFAAVSRRGFPLPCTYLYSVGRDTPDLSAIAAILKPRRATRFTNFSFFIVSPSFLLFRVYATNIKTMNNFYIRLFTLHYSL